MWANAFVEVDVMKQKKFLNWVIPLALVPMLLGLMLAGCNSENSPEAGTTDAEGTASETSEADLSSLSPSEQFAKLNERFAEEQKTGEAEPIDYAQQFWDLAQRHPDDPMAYASLRWIASLVDDPQWRDRALVKMAEDYSDREELGQLCVRMMDQKPTDGAIRFLETLSEKSTHRQVRAIATLALASSLAQADPDQRDNARIEQLYETVIEEYSDLSDLAQFAEDQLFVFRHLSIGSEAPDIVGEDLDGQPFKLSDYRGKVVMLDFWGDW